MGIMERTRRVLLTFNPGIIMLLFHSAVDQYVKGHVADGWLATGLKEGYLAAGAVVFAYTVGLRASRKSPPLTSIDVVSMLVYALGAVLWLISRYF